MVAKTSWRLRAARACCGAEPRPGGSSTPPLASANRNPVRRPVRGEDLADQVLPRHRPARARVARLRAVVAHHEVLPGRHLERLRPAGIAPVRLDVRLLEPLAVDEDVARAADVAELDPFAREAD